MENYTILSPIGKGSFSNVYKVQRKTDNSILVSKKMDYSKMNEKEKHQLVAEVNILRDLNHPNVVTYHDRIIDKQSHNIYIVMEYCPGGDLAQFLKKLSDSNQSLPEESIWKIFYQIVLALGHIHKRKNGKILHRDIKPANIFLDANYNVKLGDFGLARIMNSDSEYAKTTVGTPYYMSPELIDEHQYNDKSDIWSVGCLLYEMCTLTPPFTASNYLSLAMKIKSADIPIINYTSELQRIINWCLQKNQKDRPSIDDLFSIPYISMKIREKRLKENALVLQKREEEIKKKEKELEELEQQLQNL